MHKKVILMNPFNIPPEAVENFLARWNAVAEYMRNQPGFIATKLHRGASDESLWFNYAEWRSAEDFMKAVQTEDFKNLTKDFPGESKPNLYHLNTVITK